MSRFFYANEIARPEDVIPYLAKQERHWRKGYSAYELAYSWIGAEGIPGLVGFVLDTCPDYAGAVLVEGLFERDVDLRTPGRRSQTDLLAFVKLRHGDAVISVEGKVDEPFGDRVSAWNDHSPGKERRLAALCRSLGLRVVDVEDIRYQLLHRTARPSTKPSGTGPRGRSCWCIPLAWPTSRSATSGRSPKPWGCPFRP